MPSRRSRLVAPVAVAGLIAAGSWIPTLRASAAPNLAPSSATALISRALSSRVTQLSGEIRWTAPLGLPSLSALASGGGQAVSSGSAFDPTSLLSGSHEFGIWVGGADRQRLSSASTLQESDVVHRGNQIWVWDSATAHVTRYVLSGADASPKATAPHDWSADGAPDATAVTPQALATQILARLDRSTTSVSTLAPVQVAGHDAYRLRLAPERSVAADRASTVGDIVISIDARTGLVLRVEVHAVGQSSPALDLGFSSLHYGAPAASEFAPPTGLTTTTKVVPLARMHSGLGGRSGGRPALRHTAPSTGPRAVTVVGRDWGSIVAAPAAALHGASAGELDAVTTVVSGRWGSGRLLQTTLVNALILDNGRVLVGFVSPAALEAAAAGTQS